MFDKSAPLERLRIMKDPGVDGCLSFVTWNCLSLLCKRERAAESESGCSHRACGNRHARAGGRLPSAERRPTGLRIPAWSGSGERGNMSWWESAMAFARAAKAGWGCGGVGVWRCGVWGGTGLDTVGEEDNGPLQRWTPGKQKCFPG